ncbi:uncharacterized protein [Rutidosis leptorrhynchoides]|uniref:uncharacterized protein n=1 Tax=Rutidosis leptorrhynchoides TaxID=125765 RepID=UPI003A997D30
MKKGKAKVKWEDLCLRKDEGGLGIKWLKLWNVALITSHMWRILTNEESLWVKWIHTYHLSSCSFWDAPVKADVGWSYDTNTMVCNIVDHQGWSWPVTWVSNYPELLLLNAPVVSESNDILQWKSREECSDSNSHLFFTCKFSKEVWLRVKQLIITPGWNLDWKLFTSSIAPNASKKNANMVQERNNHLFKGRRRPTDVLYGEIYATVRLKLLSIRFKESRQVKELKIAWNMA